MDKMYKIIMILSCFICSNTLFAQVDDDEILRNHVIVALNWAPTPTPNMKAFSMKAMLAVCR